jgi:hypothetical protein
MDQPKAARGRPSKGDEAKRHSVGIRTTKALKDKMEVSCAASGRSMAQEIEYRLEQSFRDEAESADTRTLLRMISSMIFLIEHQTGKSWRDDSDSWLAVKAAVDKVLDDNRPDDTASGQVQAEVEAALDKADVTGAALREYEAAHPLIAQWRPGSRGLAPPPAAEELAAYHALMQNHIEALDVAAAFKERLAPLLKRKEAADFLGFKIAFEQEGFYRLSSARRS